MKKTRFAFVLLAAILMNYEGAHAQKLAPKSAPVTIAPDLTKLNIEKILQQLQTTNVQPSAEETSPLQVVAAFLQLSPGQVSELGQLLQARQTTLVPLFQTAQTLIQQLGNLYFSRVRSLLRVRHLTNERDRLLAYLAGVERLHEETEPAR